MAHVATFDTYKFIKKLTSEGMPERQATVVVDAVREASQVDEDHILTKPVLKAELAELKNELLKWYVGIAMFQVGGVIALVKVFNP